MWKYLLRFIAGVFIWAGFGLCFMLFCILAGIDSMSDVLFFSMAGLFFILIVPLFVIGDK